MPKPPDFVDPQFPHHVCHLKEALYGLRQAPLAWFQRFSTSLVSLSFSISRSHSPLFYLHQGKSIVFLFLYVDDIIVTVNDPSLLCCFINRTHSEFYIKDLGQLNYFLGLEVSYTSDGLFVGQEKYAHDILDRESLWILNLLLLLWSLVTHF